MNLVLPSFIFYEVIKNFEASDWPLLLEILFGCLTVYIIGLIMGALCGLILGADKRETKYLCAIFSSPNTTSLPMILIEVFSPLLETIPYDGKETISAKERGMLYISLTSIISNVWRWSVAYNLIESPAIDKRTALNEALLESEGKEKPAHPPKNNMLMNLVNTPLVVSVVTLGICCLKSFKLLLITPGGFLNESLFEVNFVIARSYNFCMLFLLGLHLADLGKDKNVDYEIREDVAVVREKGKKYNFGTYLFLSVVKLIILPIIGVPVIFMLRRFGFFSDGVLVILLFIFLSAPPANNSILITSLKGTKVTETSFILLYTNLGAMLTLTFENSLYLYLLINR